MPETWTHEQYLLGFVMHCLGEEVERLDAAAALLARWVSALRSRVGQVSDTLSRVGYVALGFWFGGEVRNELQKGIQMSAGDAPRGSSRCLGSSAWRGIQMSAGDAPHAPSRCLGSSAWRDIQMSAGRRGAALDRGSVICGRVSHGPYSAPMRCMLPPGGGPDLRSLAQIVVTAKRALQLIEADACELRPHAGSLSAVRRSVGARRRALERQPVSARRTIFVINDRRRALVG